MNSIGGFEKVMRKDMYLSKIGFRDGCHLGKVPDGDVRTNSGRDQQAVAQAPVGS
jgi:hypothetical protein